MDPLVYFKDRPISERITAYILVKYRWIFVMLFLLPLSVLYNAWKSIQNCIIFFITSAPKLHESRLRDIQSQIRNWKDKKSTLKLCTARPGWQTMSFRVGRYKTQSHKIRVNLVDILKVDEEERIVTVEPLVTMGQLSSTLLPMGLTIPVVPELDDLTVGGLLMGTGIETSSHKHGLFQHICVGLELILCDGQLVKCSSTQNSDLFYAAFWSYGTLGILVSADLKIIPAKKYVSIDYYPCHSTEEMLTKFNSEVMKKSENEFVECLVYSLDSGVVMTANMTNEAHPEKINTIGHYYKPWFFKHVKEKLQMKGEVSKEYIPLRDFYHRHSRSIFWELEDIIPFGNSRLFRYIFGWAVPPKISLLKLTQGNVIKRLYEVSHMIQDMLVPLKSLHNALELFHEEIGIYPIWLCPFILPKLPGLLQYKQIISQNDEKENSEMYVDIGVYGVVRNVKNNLIDATKKIESFVINEGGFQMLYADTYLTRHEFRKMFDHTLYDKMRKILKCEVAFPEIYDKVSKEARI